MGLIAILLLEGGYPTKGEEALSFYNDQESTGLLPQVKSRRKIGENMAVMA
jgi:hypothetical protein